MVIHEIYLFLVPGVLVCLGPQCLITPLSLMSSEGTVKSVAATISGDITQPSGILCPCARSYPNNFSIQKTSEGHSAPLTLRPNGLAKKSRKSLASSLSLLPSSPHVSSESLRVFLMPALGQLPIHSANGSQKRLFLKQI